MNKRKHEGEEKEEEGVKKQCTTLIVEPCKAMVVWEPPFDMKRYCEDYEWRVQDARSYIIDALYDAYELMEPLKELYRFAYGPPETCGCGHTDDEIAPRYWFVELAFHHFYTRPHEQWKRTHGQVAASPPSPSHT